MKNEKIGASVKICVQPDLREMLRAVSKYYSRPMTNQLRLMLLQEINQIREINPTAYIQGF